MGSIGARSDPCWNPCCALSLSFLLHSPNVVKIEVTKRSKVRRNYLSYLRKRSGKSTRLTGTDFDRQAVNTLVEIEVPAESKSQDTKAQAETSKDDVAEEKPTKSDAKAETMDTVDKTEKSEPELKA